MIRSLLRFIFLSGFILVRLTFIYAQNPIENNAFREGENITFQVSYNWGPIWVNAGLVTFSVVSEEYLGKEALHLKSVGETYASYDLIFKVRDYFESWIDPVTFRTFEFRRDI